MNRHVVALAMVALAPISLANADIVEVSGKLVGIDAKERTITIQGKTLEVAKKCAVSVDGEPVELASLKPGQIAVVKYDEGVEVATSIAIGESPKGEEASGIAIFNGTNLSGWKYLGSEDEAEKVWSIKSGGVLQCSGADNAAPLITDQKYKNFTLTLEWRFPPGVTPTVDGLGLALRVGDRDQAFKKQLRFQLQDRPQSHLWALGQSESPKALLGNVLSVNGSPLIKGPKVAKKPLGTWNTIAIHCDGEDVSVEQNGEETIHVSGVDAVAGHVGFIPAKTKAEIRKVVLTPK